MQDLSEKLKELEEKTNRLIELYSDLRDKNHLLEEENQELKQSINNQNKFSGETEGRDKTKDTEEAFIDTNKEKIKTKQIINEMMREIDKCLLLLDK